MTSKADSAGLYRQILALLEAHRPFAVATVLQTRNSTPVKAGAKAVLEAEGRIHGTVGGGAVEAEAQRLSGQVIQSGKPLIFEFDLHGPGVREPGPICGGWMRLLLVPGSVAGDEDYYRAADAVQHREPGVWVSTLDPGTTLQVKSEFVSGLARIPPSSGVSPDQVQFCLEKAECALVEQASMGGKREIFVEPLLPAPLLLLIGGGHVSQAVAKQANLVGFDIAVVEDRPAFADPALFPAGTRTCCGCVAEQIEKLRVDASCFVVIVTRGHQQDAEALRACIHLPCSYLGMIGSRRKVPLLKSELLRSGFATAPELERVYAPIGLDIGSVTVPEIAASIVAQLISVRRKGSAPRMVPT